MTTLIVVIVEFSVRNTIFGIYGPKRGHRCVFRRFWAVYDPQICHSFFWIHLHQTEKSENLDMLPPKE